MAYIINMDMQPRLFQKRGVFIQPAQKPERTQKPPDS